MTADWDIVKAARYFVAGAVAFADGQIAGWDTKYEYQRWRPISAIRLGNWYVEEGSNLVVYSSLRRSDAQIVSSCPPPPHTARTTPPVSRWTRPGSPSS